MQKIIGIVLVSTILWAAALSAGTFTMVEGRSDLIKQDHLMIGPQRYKVIYPGTEQGKTDAKTYGFETECWIVVSPMDRYRVDYITLVMVGYADLVRLTLEGDTVRIIEVLDLQQ